MTYQEFLDKYKEEINNRDFGKGVFTHLYGQRNWFQLLDDLYRLGINPLETIGHTIPNGFFMYYSWDGVIVIPSNITKIDTEAFYNSHIRGAVMTTSVQVIYRQAFYSSYLVSIVLPSSVTFVGSSCFEDCEKLKTVSIRNSTIRLGEDCFNGCNELEDIFFNGTLEQWREISKNANYKLLPAKEVKIHCSDRVVSP